MCNRGVIVQIGYQPVVRDHIRSEYEKVSFGPIVPNPLHSVGFLEHSVGFLSTCEDKGPCMCLNGGDDDCVASSCAHKRKIRTQSFLTASVQEL
mmetsp:Transcript_24509/g.58145  ORF Transcript_24509/g.58145 Transcript_24509/m.58145 type:complete len:94 (+) Transcript_24509:349-630(+)